MFSKMSRKIYLIMWLVCLCLITACNSAQEETITKISQQVSQTLQETVAAHPALPDQPTLTPRPTLTPDATYTTQPSYTPQSTPTNLPTYTPAPTLTPLPTATLTPTAAPTNTPLPRPVATAQPAVNVAAALLQEVNVTIAQMEAFRYKIPPVCQQAGSSVICDSTADCQFIVNQYDTIVAPFVLNVGSDNLTIQNAYTNYQASITIFIDSQRDWVDSCRAALATGGSVNFNHDTRMNLYFKVNDSLNILYPTKQILESPQ